jgi:large subunit ribosomal protein L9
MATTLQVVLQTNVDKVGESGELVKVRPGFARNYLIPRGLAVPATTAAVNRIAHEKSVAIAKADKTKKELQAVAEKINALKLTLTRSVGEDDKLFGSVTSKEIENAAKAAGVTIDRKKMQLAEPLKALGSFEIPVRLMADVVATLKVDVVKK